MRCEQATVGVNVCDGDWHGSITTVEGREVVVVLGIEDLKHRVYGFRGHAWRCSSGSARKLRVTNGRVWPVMAIRETGAKA